MILHFSVLKNTIFFLKHTKNKLRHILLLEVIYITENDSNNCVCDIIKEIYLIQKETKNIVDCKRKPLGACSNNSSYIRPIMLFCNNGEALKIKVDDTYSSTFKIEKVDDCCALLKALIVIPEINLSQNNIVSTNQCITVDTKKFCAIKCLNDAILDNTIIINKYTLFKDDEIIDQGTFNFGVHFFETTDPNNEQINPVYRIDIELKDLTKRYPLELINSVTTTNPNFIIQNVNFNTNVIPNILSITFEVQTEQTETTSNEISLNDTEESLFNFSIVNQNGLTNQFIFIVTIISVYP